MPPQVSTNDTMHRDLQASLVKEALESAGVCTQRFAEQTARLTVSLFSPDTYDAALWKGAEALYGFMESRADVEPLASRELTVRALYLTLAVQCFAWIRLALEGGFPEARLQQAWADIENHRTQLAARRPLRIVDGGRS